MFHTVAAHASGANSRVRGRPESPCAPGPPQLIIAGKVSRCQGTARSTDRGRPLKRGRVDQVSSVCESLQLDSRMIPGRPLLVTGAGESETRSLHHLYTSMHMLAVCADDWNQGGGCGTPG